MAQRIYKRNWPRKNLGELLDFIDRQYPDGYILDELASKLGVTAQYLSQLFGSDNMKLSAASRIAERFGYRLRLYFPEKEWFGWGTPPIMKREFPNAGILAGLANYVRQNGRSINYLSKQLGRTNHVLTDAFNKGDIYINTLYDLTKFLNIEFIWSFEQIETDKQINN